MKITINNRKTVPAPAGRSLYAALTEAGVFIPSACGGRGGCGLCRLRVTRGAESQPLTRSELHWLKPEERAAGLRLSCQVQVLSDLQVAIPEGLLGIRSFEAEVAALVDLTYDIKEVRLRLLNPPEMAFKPGQYIQFRVPPNPLSKRVVFRAYSIASDPAERGELVLHVRYVPNGISTTYIHQQLKAGDRVVFNGPHGDFFLRESDREIVFIAGGSGMAPVRSMLLDMARRGIRRPTRYFFGAKTVRDLFLVDEMKALEKKLPDFTFIPALSAPAPGDAWEGETGLITEVVARRLKAPAPREAYLCGSPMMVEACIAVLKTKGMPEELLFFDKFA